MNFTLKYKNIFLIIGFTVIVLVFGYLLYIFFFKPTIIEPIVTLPTPTTTPSGLPIAPEGGGQIITPSPPGTLPPDQEQEPKKVVSPIAQGGYTETTELNQASSKGVTLSGDGDNLNFYNQDDGKFYQIDKNGKTVPLTDKVFHNVESIVWSPNKDKAVLEYPDGANIVYDFNTKKQVTLPAHWEDFNFSPDGDGIVMKSIGLDPNNRWLAISNVDGSKARAIEALGDNADIVYPSWSPNKQTIAMFTEGIDFDRQEVYFVGLNNENFKSMVIEGRGFEPLWSPEGDRLLYSVYSSNDDMKPRLWIANAQGESIGTGRKNLNIATWASKCTFTNSSDAYCAVPENLPEGAGLFPELAKTTSDRLYRIDTLTGQKRLIAIPDGTYNMSNLVISDNGYYLYFTDASTNRIHKIKLK